MRLVTPDSQDRVPGDRSSKNDGLDAIDKLAVRAARKREETSP